MELVTIRLDGGTRAGRVEDDLVVLLEAESVKHILEDPAGLDVAARAETGSTVPLADADLAPVIPDPAKIVCIGANYRDHIEEMGRTPPSHPTYFAKYARALVGARDDLVLPPPELSTDIDWEGELAVIIGKPERNVSVSDALDAIAGFCVLNDVSVRDWQRRTSQFLAGKTYEGLTPLGPALVTRDQAGDGSGLALTTTVNGVVKQDSNTSNLVFNAVDAVTDLSRIMTLEPGDVIATGTPGGVGVARTPPEFLRPGDDVVITIEGLGSLTNHCR
jgi:acylpyruvate hydrolase